MSSAVTVLHKVQRRAGQQHLCSIFHTNITQTTPRTTIRIKYFTGTNHSYREI